MPLPARLLDTDVVIDVEHRHPAALAWFSSAPAGSLALPGYVLLELYDQAQNSAQLRMTDALLAGLPILWPAQADCAQAVTHFRTLHLSHGIGLLDALIATTALSLSLPLCTFNIKHFRHIPGLITEQPYTR